MLLSTRLMTSFLLLGFKQCLSLLSCSSMCTSLRAIPRTLKNELSIQRTSPESFINLENLSTGDPVAWNSTGSRPTHTPTFSPCYSDLLSLPAATHVNQTSTKIHLFPSPPWSTFVFHPTRPPSENDQALHSLTRN